jgi:hypothetical protein
MESMLRLCLALLLFSFSALAAEPECLGDIQHGLYQMSWAEVPNVSFQNIRPLPTMQMGELKDSQAKIRHVWNAESLELSLEFSLPLPQSQFGLPYTVYAIELSWVGVNGSEQYFIDYTQHCNSGRSYFPRGGFAIGPLSLPSDAKEIHLKVWGQRN